MEGANTDNTTNAGAARPGDARTTTRTPPAPRTTSGAGGATGTTADTTGASGGAGRPGAEAAAKAGPRYVVDGHEVDRETYLKAAEERNWNPQFLVERNYFPAL